MSADSHRRHRHRTEPAERSDLPYALPPREHPPPEVAVPPSSSSEFEQLFAHLKQDLDHLQTLIQSVQAFQQRVEHGIQEGIFDQEDWQRVDADLKELVHTKEQKEQELVAKETLYRNSVLKLEDILARRKQAIEEAEQATRALSLRPELLKHFAKKRAHLMLMVDKGKQDLQK